MHTALFGKEMAETEKGLIARCNRIVKGIKKDYPLLGGARIEIVLKPQKKGSMIAKRKGKRRYLIEVDYRKYVKANYTELLGALVHELAHFEEYSKMGVLGYWIFLLMSRLSRSYSRRIERGADMQTIRKGYGRALLANRKMRREDMGEVSYRKAITIYMSNEEIRKELADRKR